MPTVRPPAVAGLFYPGTRHQLMTAITAMLDDARPELAPDLPLPKALLLPHAGYIYSGSTAALGYAALERGRGTIRRVVLLGPTHRVWTDGVVLPGVDTLGTPLGEVRVARVATELQDLPQVGVSAEAHAAEHSLEVHLPFLQMVLGDIEVVPLAVGRAEPGEVADVLDALWGGSETVVVVSSDLSHYLPYDAAERVDEATVEQMLRLDLPLTHDQACGATPANGLLLAAQRHGLVPRLLARCSSGDTAGDRRRVVGYVALAFLRPVTD